MHTDDGHAIAYNDVDCKVLITITNFYALNDVVTNKPKCIEILDKSKSDYAKRVANSLKGTRVVGGDTNNRGTQRRCLKRQIQHFKMVEK